MILLAFAAAGHMRRRYRQHEKHTRRLFGRLVCDAGMIMAYEAHRCPTYAIVLVASVPGRPRAESRMDGGITSASGSATGNSTRPLCSLSPRMW